VQQGKRESISRSGGANVFTPGAAGDGVKTPTRRLPGLDHGSARSAGTTRSLPPPDPPPPTPPPPPTTPPPPSPSSRPRAVEFKHARRHGAARHQCRLAAPHRESRSRARTAPSRRGFSRYFGAQPAAFAREVAPALLRLRPGERRPEILGCRSARRNWVAASQRGARDALGRCRAGPARKELVDHVARALRTRRPAATARAQSPNAPRLAAPKRSPKRE